MLSTLFVHKRQHSVRTIWISRVSICYEYTSAEKHVPFPADVNEGMWRECEENFPLDMCRFVKTARIYSTKMEKPITVRSVKTQGLLTKPYES